MRVLAQRDESYSVFKLEPQGAAVRRYVPPSRTAPAWAQLWPQHKAMARGETKLVEFGRATLEHRSIEISRLGTACAVSAAPLAQYRRPEQLRRQCLDAGIRGEIRPWLDASHDEILLVHEQAAAGDAPVPVFSDKSAHGAGTHDAQDCINVAGKPGEARKMRHVAPSVLGWVRPALQCLGREEIEHDACQPCLRVIPGTWSGTPLAAAHDPTHPLRTSLRTCN